MSNEEMFQAFMKEIAELKKNINEIKKELIDPLPKYPVSDKWLKRSDLMAWLDYGDTAMAMLGEKENLIVTKVGKRKFYLRESIEKLLESNIIR